jgi:LPXTG-site transpeptidase (sortase) family protein
MRRRNSPFKRLVVGFFIIVGAVVTFNIYQMLNRRSAVPTLSTTPTAQPVTIAATASASLPTSTKTAIAAATAVKPTLRLISEKALLSAEITTIYLARTDNWDLTSLGDRAGHLEGTANLGQGGNYVLAGHVELKDGRSGPFVSIHKLKPGDSITILQTAEANPFVVHYIVTEVKEVSPQDFNVIYNHGFEELTLITCKDWDENLATYQRRIVVHARLAIGKIPNLSATRQAP